MNAEFKQLSTGWIASAQEAASEDHHLIMMNKKSILATWVMCLSMTAIFSQKQTVMQTKTMTKDELAVLQTVETMTKAFNGKDIEVVMGSYQKDALVIFEPGMQVRNFKQLKEMFLAAFAINPKFEYPQGHEIFVNGDNATLLTRSPG